MVERNDPELGAERPKNWGGTTAFGADVGLIDLGRIDSGADRPVPYVYNVHVLPVRKTPEKINTRRTANRWRVLDNPAPLP